MVCFFAQMCQYFIRLEIRLVDCMIRTIYILLKFLNNVVASSRSFNDAMV